MAARPAAPDEWDRWAEAEAEAVVRYATMVAASPKQPAAELIAVLGRSAKFDGKLTFEGAVRIDGKFKGVVLSEGTLVVGRTAEVDAEIAVGEIIVEGTVNGNITAKRSIEIRSSGSVTGDLNTPTLQIDKGAIFDGRSVMSSAMTPTPNK
jgi:cytoskeletal protein CcmA (bactofilin family)